MVCWLLFSCVFSQWDHGLFRVKYMDPYVKGLNYNNEIENARIQNASGWNIEIAQTPEAIEGRFEIQINRPDDSLPPPPRSKSNFH